HACLTRALAERGVRAPAEAADAHGGILAVTYHVPMRSRVWAACTLLVAGCAGGALTARTESVESFVARHWRMPLAPQGTPPARYPALEASLVPESCGTCHPAQLADWRTSTHASSMGPGVVGQLVELQAREPRTALACQHCHAPLAEQAPVVAKTL